ALDHAGIVVPAEDVGGAADVRPLRLRQARVIEGANLVHRLLEAIVGTVDLAGVALAGLRERRREGSDVLLDRLPHVRVFLAEVVEGVGAEGLLEVTADLAHLLAVPAAAELLRSEERRVGKECRRRRSPVHGKKRREGAMTLS